MVNPIHHATINGWHKPSIIGLYGLYKALPHFHIYLSHSNSKKNESPIFPATARFEVFQFSGSVSSTSTTSTASTGSVTSPAWPCHVHRSQRHQCHGCGGHGRHGRSRHGRHTAWPRFMALAAPWSAKALSSPHQIHQVSPS